MLNKPLKIAATSTEYIQVKATYLQNGVVVDPTNSQVQMAFVKPDVNPVQQDWLQANWSANTDNKGYYILCLIGPGSDNEALPVGFYNVWIQLYNDPEIIVKRAGSLTVE